MKVNISNPNSINVSVKRRPALYVNQTAISRTLSDLSDVNISGRTDGGILIWDETNNEFIISTVLNKQEINGGHF